MLPKSDTPKFSKDEWNDIFRMRARAFSDRMGWNVKVNEQGHERDQFDNSGTEYFLCKFGDVPVASLRFIPPFRQRMFDSVFGFETAGWTMGRSPWEVSRICSNTQLQPTIRRYCVQLLLVELMERCVAGDIDSFVGVVYPQTLRTIRLAGWSGEVIDRLKFNKEDLILSKWYCNEELCRKLKSRHATLNSNMNLLFKYCSVKSSVLSCAVVKYFQAEMCRAGEQKVA